MIKFIGNLFESSHKKQIVLTNSEPNDSAKTQTLDPSTSLIVQLPKSFQQIKEASARWPEGFWDHVNAANSYYTQGCYAKAKAELLCARELKQDYQYLDAQLLRVLRKLYKNSIERKNWRDAYGFLTELFKVIPDLVTNSDRRQFNIVTSILHDIEPEFKGHPLELAAKIKANVVVPLAKLEPGEKTSFHIHMEIDPSVQSKEEKPIYWHKGYFTSNGAVFCRRIYGPEQANNRYHFRAFSDQGVFSSDLEIPLDFHGINISQSGDRLIGYTEDLHLFLYSMKGELISERTIRREGKNKSQIRCIDISANGKYALFTAATRSYFLDDKLKTLRTWVMPPPEGYRVEKNEPNATSKEICDAMALLDLRGSPSKDEIKTNFRRLVQKYHPDKNPGDLAAEEKTKSIIIAYRFLSDEDPLQALEGFDNIEAYLKTIEEIDIEFKELGVKFKVNMSIGGPGDWIYASHISANAERIYLGSYSGRVYCINEEGRVLKTYITDDVIRRIEERSPFLYIQTNYGIYVIHNDKILNHIEIGDSELHTFAEWGFILKKDSLISLYELDGNLIGKIQFSTSPYEVVPIKQGLIVRAKKSNFLVSLS